MDKKELSPLGKLLLILKNTKKFRVVPFRQGYFIIEIKRSYLPVWLHWERSGLFSTEQNATEFISKYITAIAQKPITFN